MSNELPDLGDLRLQRRVRDEAAHGVERWRQAAEGRTVDLVDDPLPLLIRSDDEKPNLDVRLHRDQVGHAEEA
jgi:hypothetical protein